MQVAQKERWNETATQKANEISLAFDVFLAWGGQIAMWVLFACMISNIIQIIPGLGLPATVSNIILAVQAIMLDLGGFSLNSIAKKATDPGIRRKGLATGNTLIGIMILTMLLLTIKVELSKFEPVVQFCNYAESGLILARVALTVFYLHVIHELRHDQMENPTAPQTIVPQPTQEELEKQIQKILAPHVQDLNTNIENQLAQFQNQQAEPAAPQTIDYSEIMKVVFPQVRKVVHAELTSSSITPTIPTLRTRAKPVPKTREERLENTYQSLLAEGKTPSGQALATLAKCSKKAALDWLKTKTTKPSIEDQAGHPEPTEAQKNSVSEAQIEPEEEVKEQQETNEITGEYEVLEQEDQEREEAEN